jgi:hypothetical protein
MRRSHPLACSVVHLSPCSPRCPFSNAHRCNLTKVGLEAIQFVAAVGTMPTINYDRSDFSCKTCIDERL